MARSSRRPIATSACKHSPRRGALGVSSRIFGPGILHQPLTKQTTQPGCPRSGFSDRGLHRLQRLSTLPLRASVCPSPGIETRKSALRLRSITARSGTILPTEQYPDGCNLPQPANRTSVTPPSRAFVRKSVENFRPFPRFQHTHSPQSIRPERGKKHIPPPCFG